MAKVMTNFHIFCDLFPYATSFMSKYIRIWYIILGLINMSYSVIECFLEEKKLCQLIWEYSTPALLLGDFRWTRVLEGGWKGLWPDCSPCNFHRNVIYTKRIFSLPPSTIFVWMNSLFWTREEVIPSSNHSDEVTWKMMASENKYGQKSLFMNDVFNGEGQCVGQGINSGNKRMFEDIWSQDNIPESIWPFKHPTTSVF